MVFQSRVLAALDLSDFTGAYLVREEVITQPDEPLYASEGPLSSESSQQKQRSSKKPPVSASGKNPIPREPTIENPNLPKYCYKTYKPTAWIVYCRSEEEVDEILPSMSGPFGFDMEWKVIWRTGGYRSFRTALVQLSDDKIILLAQLSAMKKFPQELRRIIESPNIIKLGVNIRGDGEKLFRDYGVLAANLVELGGVANQADPSFAAKYQRPMVALAKMVEYYEQKILVKGKVRISNWELELNKEQQEYAANDAHCARVVYDKLLSMAKLNDCSLDPQKFTCDLRNEYRRGKLTMTTPQYIIKEQGKNTVEVGLLKASPQQLRAYDLWHNHKMSLPNICAMLRSKENPLKEATVISYVIHTLQSNETLPFDKQRLKALVHEDLGSWSRHGAWIVELDRIRCPLNVSL